MRYVIALMLVVALPAAGGDKYYSKTFGYWTNASSILPLAKADLNSVTLLSRRRGVDLLSELAKAGNPEAARIVGFYHLKNDAGNRELALEYLLIGANLGDTDCMAEYGGYMLGGRQPRVGVDWLERAISKGNQSAKLKLGEALLDGKYLTIDRARGERLLGEARGFSLLARLTKDPSDKYKWLRVAQLDGQDVHSLLSSVSGQLTTAQLAKADAAATAYWKKLPAR